MIRAGALRVASGGRCRRGPETLWLFPVDRDGGVGVVGPVVAWSECELVVEWWRLEWLAPNGHRASDRWPQVLGLGAPVAGGVGGGAWPGQAVRC